MANEIPSIGAEEQKGFRKVKLQAPLPKVRSDVVAAISSILGQGGVQKLTIEVGKPITFERMVREGELPELPEAPDEDQFWEARNAEMLDFPKPEVSFFEYLFKAFGLVSQRKLFPKNFIVSSMKTFNALLGLEELNQTNEAFGLAVLVDTRLPQGVALLTATNATNDKVELSIRLAIDPPKKKK